MQVKDWHTRKIRTEQCEYWLLSKDFFKIKKENEYPQLPNLKFNDNISTVQFTQEEHQL